MVTVTLCRHRTDPRRRCQHPRWRTSRAPGHIGEMLLTSALIPPLSVFWRLYGAVKFGVWFL